MDYLKQDRQDDTTYAMVLRPLKNGSLEVIAYDCWRNRAFKTTTKGWYPAPVEIDRSDIPEKAIIKMERHMRALLNR